MINEEIAKELAKLDTHEEALAYLKNEGIELTDEELDEIAGGWTERDDIVLPYLIDYFSDIN